MNKEQNKPLDNQKPISTKYKIEEEIQETSGNFFDKQREQQSTRDDSESFEDEFILVDDQETENTIESKTNLDEINFPTQFVKVGQVRCLFLSFYYKGRTPIISIGPSWPFSLFLIFFAAFIAGFFGFIIHFMKHKTMITLIVMYGMIAINIISLFFGMLQNPGIHQNIYDLYLKKYQKSNGKASRVVNQDEESGLSHKRINRSDVKDKKELRYCRDCDFWYDRHTYHQINYQ